MADKENATMNNRKIRYYFTLDEVFENFNLTAVQALISAQTASAPTLDEAFGDVLNILNDEFYDWYVGYVDVMAACPITDTPEPSELEIAALKKKFLRKLTSEYNFTKDKYIYLLNLYEDQKTHLMDKLSTSVTTTGSKTTSGTTSNREVIDGESTSTSLRTDNLANSSTTTHTGTEGVIGTKDVTDTRTDNLANSSTVTHTGTEGISATEGTGVVHRVNDTPQNGGAWTADAHTSVYETTDTDVSKSSTTTKNLTDTTSGTNTGTQTSVIDEDTSSTTTKNLTDTASGTNTGTQSTSGSGTEDKTVTNSGSNSGTESASGSSNTSMDPMTIMMRIKEIQDHYMKVIRAWCKEFEQLFIPPYNEFED